MPGDPVVAAALLLMGIVTGFVLNRVFTRITDAGIDRVLGVLRRGWHKFTAGFVRSPAQRVLPPHTYSIGPVSVRFCLITHEVYVPGSIRGYYQPGLLYLPPDLARLRETRAAEYEERARAGERVPYNSDKYKLREFNEAFRDVVRGVERPVLLLHFTDTDYWTQEVTNNDLSNPVRNRYLRAADLSKRPIPEFASVFGVTLTLVTADRQMLLARRSINAAVSPGQLSTSISEGALRPRDGGPDGSPDPYRTAVRGVFEELRIELSETDVEFLGFGVDADTAIYNLIGWARLPLTRQQIESVLMNDPPTDRWEQEVFFVPFEPNRFAEFCVANAPTWAPVGLVAVILALERDGHSRNEIERAFAKVQRARGLTPAFVATVS